MEERAHGLGEARGEDRGEAAAAVEKTASEARKRRAEVCQPFLLKREPTESESYVHEAGAAPGVVGVPDPDLALALLRDRRGVVHRASGHTPSDPPPLRV